MAAHLPSPHLTCTHARAPCPSPSLFLSLSRTCCAPSGSVATQTPRHSSVEQGPNQHLLPGWENHKHSVLSQSFVDLLPLEMTFNHLFICTFDFALTLYVQCHWILYIILNAALNQFCTNGNLEPCACIALTVRRYVAEKLILVNGVLFHL